MMVMTMATAAATAMVRAMDVMHDDYDGCFDKL
jgi:hypothetical protein